MPLLMLLIFAGVPLIEVYLFIELGGLLGALWTVALCILTAVIGVSTVRIQGRAALERARQSMMRGRFPAAEAFHGVCLAIAGILLLTPGFFTDALGFLLLVPVTRMLLVAFLGRHVHVYDARGDTGTHGPVIDGEWEVVDNPDPPPVNPRHLDKPKDGWRAPDP